MKLIKSAWFVILFTGFCFAQNAPKVYFNEVRADDNGTDDAEFIEIIGPAGTDLTGYFVEHRNGNGNSVIFSFTIGSFIIPDDGILDEDGNALGFYVRADPGVTNSDENLPSSDIQNGADGLLLYDTDPEFGGRLLDVIAWGGIEDLFSGDLSNIEPYSAANYFAMIGNDDNGDNSLQAPNAVFSDNGNNWILDAATPGAINVGQASGSIQLTSSETTRPVAMLTSASGNPLTITATLSDGQTGIVSIEVKTLTDASLTIDGTPVNVNDIFTTYAKASLDITATGSSSASRINLIISDAVGNETVWFFDFMQ